MRFTQFALPALAAAPSLVSAAGTLGFALGSKNADGSCKFQKDYEMDFDSISEASGSKLVRGYSASDCNYAKEILPAAKAKGFKVVLGVWPDVDESYNKDKAALQENVPKFKDQVYAVTVGSETLYRGNFTGDELLSKIKEVKGLLGETKVGTADSWNKWADGTGDAVIKGKPDIIFVNAFGYWQGQAIENATHIYLDDIMQAYSHIEAVGGGSIEMWNGETGWPTDGGTDYGAAKAGTANAKAYFQNGVCALVKWGYNVFFFEAFDEPWKPHAVGDSGAAGDETKWGAMDANRKLKFPITCS